jgi:hypothetical protein
MAAKRPCCDGKGKQNCDLCDSCCCCEVTEKLGSWHRPAGANEAFKLLVRRSVPQSEGTESQGPP